MGGDFVPAVLSLFVGEFGPSQMVFRFDTGEPLIHKIDRDTGLLCEPVGERDGFLRFFACFAAKVNREADHKLGDPLFANKPPEVLGIRLFTLSGINFVRAGKDAVRVAYGDPNSDGSVINTNNTHGKMRNEKGTGKKSGHFSFEKIALDQNLLFLLK